LLFAPVYFSEVVYTRPGFYYTPRICVDAGLLTEHFFVRPRYHHYYFGDYYEPSYAGLGILPWFAFHVSRGGYDPIFVYHRHYVHGRERGWDEQLRREYDRRREVREERPARTPGYGHHIRA
jgi:hypothetical protein